MSDLSRSDGTPELGIDELEAHRGTPLPTRTVMTTINVDVGFPVDNFAMPINLAHAVNNESSSSWAIADADQVVIIDQADTNG
jgi:hypothetical protein